MSFGEIFHLFHNLKKAAPKTYRVFEKAYGLDILNKKTIMSGFTNFKMVNLTSITMSGGDT